MSGESSNGDNDEQRQLSRYRILADHILSKARPSLTNRNVKRTMTSNEKSDESAGDDDYETNEEYDEEDERRTSLNGTSEGMINGKHHVDASEDTNESSNLIRLKNGYLLDANNVISMNHFKYTILSFLFKKVKIQVIESLNYAKYAKIMLNLFTIISKIVF